MANQLKIRLSAVRVNAGLSQEELASKMRVSRATIVNWESNKVKMSEADLTLYSTICGFPKEHIFLPY
jgi:DNA-binding XRE family transcriptional regulator|nr:MAG TPA: Helix-turn-helix XRE-family like protein [Caudoviricetes sp.]